jgi:hypothetical protein
MEFFFYFSRSTRQLKVNISSLGVETCAANFHVVNENSTQMKKIYYKFNLLNIVHLFGNFFKNFQ